MFHIICSVRSLRFVSIVLAAALALFFASTKLYSLPPATQRPAEVEEIERVLNAQVSAWNQGDIDTFMLGYWNDARLTFSSGGNVERGWVQTRDRYRSRYPDRATMGKLAFSNLETQVLNGDAAMTLGEWHLDRDKPIGGAFTLVWKRTSDGWKIIHDHTSVKPPKGS